MIAHPSPPSSNREEELPLQRCPLQRLDTAPLWTVAERDAWKEMLAGAGLDYEVVADLCEAHDLPRPSRMSEALRLKLFARLHRPEGRVRYQRMAETRALLLEMAGARGYADESSMTPKERHTAALRARLLDGKGRPRTAPTELSARELTALIRAYIDTFTPTTETAT